MNSSKVTFMYSASIEINGFMLKIHEVMSN